MTGAGVWSLANGPDNPKATNVTIDTTVLTNETKLNWLKVEGAVGYEVVWRPTDRGVWTHYIEVGDVTTATLDIRYVLSKCLGFARLTALQQG